MANPAPARRLPFGWEPTLGQIVMIVAGVLLMLFGFHVIQNTGDTLWQWVFIGLWLVGFALG